MSLASVSQTPRQHGVSDDGPGPYEDYWSCTASELTLKLRSSPKGLSSSEATERMKRSRGLPSHHHRPQLIILLRQFATPITLILVVATLLSAALGETVDAGIILTIILLSGLLSFWQENSASRAMEDLLATVEVTVEVRRDGASQYVPAGEVVAGDVVVLDAGDLVPGDCRMLKARELLVDEAPLTGESYPVEKSPGDISADTPLNSRANCVFMGTHVVRGQAEVLVVRVGNATEFGKIARRLEESLPPTAFETGINAFGLLLIRVMAVVVTLVLLTNLVLGRPLIDSLLFSLALAVGLTPQLLPAIVSVSLSTGARTMAQAKVIVKRLSSIEDFGGMDVLCTDKTGTLTVGTVVLEAALDIEGRASERVRSYAYLNSLYHTGFSNPIDDAVLASGPLDASGIVPLAEAIYDFMRKRLSVLVTTDGSTFLIMKGAVENVLAACQTVERPDGSLVDLAEIIDQTKGQFSRLSSEGYRVLGIAWKPSERRTDLSPDDETGMIFLGFLAFSDPPKPRIKEVIQEISGLGISLRMVTGDNRLAAAHVAAAVGLKYEALLTGEDVKRMSDAQLEYEVEKVDVFAEVDPVQKERIVRTLRRRGHTVGFLGDGLNDAPALHAADVGISVDTAVDVAKDSASIVLLEKDLQVLIQGVKLGRRTFANTAKYLSVTTSANFGNMVSMGAATIFLPYLPLLPMQILLLNLVSDLPAATISRDSVDAEQVLQPGVWDMRFIRGFMILFGLISSLFDIFTFFVLRVGFGASEQIFRSGWFIESLGTELAVMLVLRTRRHFWASQPVTLLLVSSGVVAALSFSSTLTPIGEIFGFVSLSPVLLLALAGILGGYIVVTELGKSLFYSAKSNDA